MHPVETLESRLHYATDLLPDLVPSGSALQHLRFGASPMWAPGRLLLRFDNIVANLGAGPLEISADVLLPHPVSGDTIPVSQRVYNTDGGYAARSAGVMEFHDEGTHHHFHFEDFAHYTLRAALPGGVVGDVIRSGEKAGFCLGDSAIVQQSRPDRPLFPVYYTCYPVGGISVGWGDLYDQTIDFQWVDVTGLPTGQYYLESTADPDNRLLESNESNNTTRILVTLNIPKMGDVTGDGKVDRADLKIVLQNMNQSNKTWSTGDLTGDGKVTLADYQVLEYGFSQPTTPAPAAAPAPASPPRRLNPVLEPDARPVIRR